MIQFVFTFLQDFNDFLYFLEEWLQAEKACQTSFILHSLQLDLCQGKLDFQDIPICFSHSRWQLQSGCYYQSLWTSYKLTVVEVTMISLCLCPWQLQEHKRGRVGGYSLMLNAVFYWWTAAQFDVLKNCCSMVWKSSFFSGRPFSFNPWLEWSQVLIYRSKD